jgi:thiamine biosynthesis lipoprotein
MSDHTVQWPVWHSTARLIVTDPSTLRAARRLVSDELNAVERACSRFRTDAEIRALHLAAGRTVRVSPLLAELIAVSLRAAERTDGDVDPTVGSAMVRLGRRRDLSRLPACGGAIVAQRPVPGWQQVRLVDRDATLPVGVLLDLGATAKAHAADRCAQLVARVYGTGVLVGLGGDVATAGPAPAGGWRVQLHEHPVSTVTLAAGGALATSNIASRGGRAPHHILDPRTGQPAAPVWRSVSVAAGSCLAANTASTAALVRGHEAQDWLRQQGTPARLIGASGDVLTVGDWPGPS